MNLADKHRPRSLEAVAGQEDAVRAIRSVLARGWGGRAWWITGASGTGKSTLALIIAELGADQLGIEELDAQRLTPAKLREVEQDSRYRMLGDKPGKVFIVNEAHGLRRDTIRLLLVLLERLPEHVVWVFTTTKAGEASLFEDDTSGDASPLLSRCTEITLANGPATALAFAQRAKAVAMAEGMDGLPIGVYTRAVQASQCNMRRLLQRVESGEFRRDAVTQLESELESVQATKGEYGERRRKELQAAIQAAKGGA
jgi:replication-associated recombination protein RarA